MSGLGDKATGKMKEMAGDVTGNQKLQAEGKLVQVKGEAKDVVSDASDSFKERIDRPSDHDDLRSDDAHGIDRTGDARL